MSEVFPVGYLFTHATPLVKVAVLLREVLRWGGLLGCTLVHIFLVPRGVFFSRSNLPSCLCQSHMPWSFLPHSCPTWRQILLGSLETLLPDGDGRAVQLPICRLPLDLMNHAPQFPPAQSGERTHVEYKHSVYSTQTVIAIVKSLL